MEQLNKIDPTTTHHVLATPIRFEGRFEKYEDLGIIFFNFFLFIKKYLS